MSSAARCVSQHAASLGPRPAAALRRPTARRRLGGCLGLAASACFLLAITSHGPVPALQVVCFQGVARPHPAPRDEAATRVPATAQLPHGHHNYLVAWQRRGDRRSRGVRVETVSVDQVGSRYERACARSRERRVPVLLIAYHDANAPPALVPFASGRHS